MKNKRLHTTDNPNTTAERKLFDFVLIIICLVFGLRLVYGAFIVLVQEQSSHKLIGVGNLFLSS